MHRGGWYDLDVGGLFWTGSGSRPVPVPTSSGSSPFQFLSWLINWIRLDSTVELIYIDFLSTFIYFVFFLFSSILYIYIYIYIYIYHTCLYVSYICIFVRVFTYFVYMNMYVCMFL